MPAKLFLIFTNSAFSKIESCLLNTESLTWMASRRSLKSNDSAGEGRHDGETDWRVDELVELVPRGVLGGACSRAQLTEGGGKADGSQGDSGRDVEPEVTVREEVRTANKRHNVQSEVGDEGCEEAFGEASFR